MNFLDLDIEVLERRLELVEPGSCECYYCMIDSNCPGSPQPVDDQVDSI